MPDDSERAQQELKLLILLARGLESNSGQAAAEVGQTYVVLESCASS